MNGAAAVTHSSIARRAHVHEPWSSRTEWNLMLLRADFMAHFGGRGARAMCTVNRSGIMRLLHGGPLTQIRVLSQFPPACRSRSKDGFRPCSTSIPVPEDQPSVPGQFELGDRMQVAGPAGSTKARPSGADPSGSAAHVHPPHPKKKPLHIQLASSASLIAVTERYPRCPFVSRRARVMLAGERAPAVPRRPAHSL